MDKRLFSESELTELESIEILGGIDSQAGVTFSNCVIQAQCSHNACTHATCVYGNCSNANCTPQLGCVPVQANCGQPQTACSETHNTCS